MLTSVHCPLDVLSWTITTSLDGKGTCLHMLVLILELTNVTALGLAPQVYLLVGYATRQCELALVLPTEFRTGSCKTSTSHLSEMGLLIRVS